MSRQDIVELRELLIRRSDDPEKNSAEIVLDFVDKWGDFEEA